MTKAEAIAMLKQIQEPEAWEPQINQAAFEALDMAIKALEQQPCEDDAISRAETVQFLTNHSSDFEDVKIRMAFQAAASLVNNPHNLPSAQPEPLSDAYTKAVWTWLLEYQIKAAELKGRYTPYEVLSWVTNDWRKEHERSD